MDNMDNINKENTSATDWLDQMLGTQNTPKELGVDEMAVAAAGLTRPEDAELEQIIRETRSEAWNDIPLAETTVLPDISTVKEAAEAEIAPQVVEETEPAVIPEAFPATDPELVLDTEIIAEETQAAPVAETPAADAPAVPEAAVKEEALAEKPAAKREKLGFSGWVKKTWKQLRKKRKPKDNFWGLPHVLSSMIWLAVIVAIGTSVGRLGWLCAKDVLALGKTPKELVFVIDETDDISTVAQRLKQLDMIEYPMLFELFANITNKGDNLQIGTITFQGDIVYDYNALCNAMTHKSTAKATVEVVIPEGYSCAQIFALLEEKGVCTVRELEAYAANGELDDYWFLEEVERGHKYCLEGFLFPDTYEFYVGDSAERVLEKFLDDFDYRFNDRMQEKFTNLNKNLKLKLSVREVIIMASIIEKEKANHLEGYTVSSVFYNRLTHAASYPYLNSDATLLYDVEYYTGPGITNEQRAKSPYNTYTRKGLPIGPIANPGMGSIDAALSPEDTDYYYFIFDKKAGQHLFSKTLAEHQKKAKELGLS